MGVGGCAPGSARWPGGHGEGFANFAPHRAPGPRTIALITAIVLPGSAARRLQAWPPKTQQPRPVPRPGRAPSTSKVSGRAAPPPEMFAKRLLSRKSEIADEAATADSEGDLFEEADEARGPGRLPVTRRKAGWLPFTRRRRRRRSSRRRPLVQALHVRPIHAAAARLPLQAQLHPDAHDEGGLACNNKELLEAQRRWAGARREYLALCTQRSACLQQGAGEASHKAAHLPGTVPTRPALHPIPHPPPPPVARPQRGGGGHQEPGQEPDHRCGGAAGRPVCGWPAAAAVAACWLVGT